MSGAQRKKLTKTLEKSKDQSVEEAIESAKSGAQITQIVVTVTADTHEAIKQVAKEDETSQDEATVTLIEEALTGRGLI